MTTRVNWAIGANPALKTTGTTTAFVNAIFKAGDRYLADDNTEWIYGWVATGQTIAQYDFVNIDETFTVSQLTSTLALTFKMIGVAQIAFAANEMGWFAVEGANLKGNVITACDSGKWLVTSATAGKLNMVYTTFVPLQGVSIATTIAATGPGTLIINGKIRPQLRTSGV